MKPFEVLGDDGHIYLHFDNWCHWRAETLSAHPGEGKWRFDLDLRYPRDTLEEVPVTNPQVHSVGGGYNNHTCFYECDDWSTIYDFYESSGESMYRMIVESQNPEPLWGERIRLLSTSSYFKCEPWGRNPPNQFAFFRGQYWQVNYSKLLYHEFPAGVGYPLRDGGPFGVPRRGGERNPLMGYRGTEFIDAGYFYAPYIPLYQTSWARSYLKPEFNLDWKKYGF
jgi:hypothetical protein